MLSFSLFLSACLPGVRERERVCVCVCVYAGGEEEREEEKDEKIACLHAWLNIYLRFSCVSLRRREWVRE